MRIFVLILFFSLPSSGLAENLKISDLIGTWTQEIEISKNERMALRVEPNLESYFLRDLIEHPDQSFKSEAKLIDDIWIFDFDSSGKYGYKLVLSGWKQGNSIALFGTMFMYSKGELYNGVDVSFRKDS